MARVSSQKQATEGYSLETQVELMTGVNDKYGFATRPEYILIDDGFEGDDWNRPAIIRGVELIRKREVQALTFMEVDRFARDLHGGLELLRKVKEAGGQIIFGDIGPVRDDGNFKIILHVKLMLSEWEKTRIRNKSREVVLAKVRNLKQVFGGHALYGYRYIGKHEAQIPRMEIDPEQAEIVRRIFHYYDNMMSLRQIAFKLQADGVPTPGRKRKDGLLSQGWHPSTIRGILANEAYLGNWHYNKTYYEEPKVIRDPQKPRHRRRTTHHLRDREEWLAVTIPAIIEDRALFDRCQKRLSANINFGGRPSDRYILTGLIWCANCGRRACGKRTGRSNYYYICTTVRKQRHWECGECDASAVPIASLETLVWDSFTEVFTDEAVLTRLIKEHEKRTSRAKPSEREQLQRRIEELFQTELRYRGDSGRLNPRDSRAKETRAHYEKLIAETKEQRESLERELASKAPMTDRLDIPTLVRKVRELTKSVSRCETKKIMAQYITRVEYYDCDVTIHVAIPIVGQKCLGDQPHPNSFVQLTLERRLAA